MARLLLLLQIATFGFGCGDVSDQALESGATPAATGAGVYKIHCAGCHGLDGRGDDTAECLSVLSPHIAQQTDGQLYTLIAFGTGGEMPSFDDQLSQDEILLVIQHLRQLNK